VLLAGLLVLAGVVPPASAAGQSFVGIEKEIVGATSGTPTFAPGATVEYRLRVTCSAVDAGSYCENATVVDPLPEPLELAASNPVTVTYTSGTSSVAVSGRRATVTFTTPGTGAGMRAGTEATITIRAVVPSDVSADLDGTTLTNTGTIDADNADPASSSADLRLAVSTTLASTVTKTADPTSVPAVPNRDVDYTLTAASTSNVTVDRLVLQDPADGTPSPLQHLDLVDLEALTLPRGADRVQVDWYDGTTWHPGTAVALPSDPSTLLPADLAAVEGLRFVFTKDGGRLPASGSDTAVVRLATRTNASVGSLPAGTTTVPNRASSWVERAGTSSTPVTADRPVSLVSTPPQVAVTKQFARDTLVAGQGTTVTLRATNRGKPVNRLVVAEPGPGGADLHDQGLVFGGFTGGLEWPSGATSAAIVYRLADGGTFDAGSTTTTDTVPVPATTDVDPADVVGFTITFSAPAGEDVIDESAAAVVPFAVTAAAGADATATNTTEATVVDSDGGTADDVASDDVTVSPLRVSTRVTKGIVRDEMWSVSGSSSRVGYTATVNDTGADASTVGADRLVVEDSSATSPDFWRSFDLSVVGPVAVPTNANLAVEYLENGTWKALTSATGGATLSSTVPAGVRAVAEGFRMVFTPKQAGGVLEPGFEVAPYVKVAVRATERGGSDPVAGTDRQVDNTASATVESAAASPGTDTETASDVVELRSLDGGTGPGLHPDLVLKDWLNDADTYTALTDDVRTVRLRWGTDGLPLDTVTLTDDPTTPVQDSFYDAFDLHRIRPIVPAANAGVPNAAIDPDIAFDRVTSVQLLIDGTWTDRTVAACAAGCDGRFPGYELSAAEREQTTAVRLTFAEGSARTATSDPAIGSGVTPSDERPVYLDLGIRKTLRSDPARYVLGTTHSYGYNTGTPGLVDNHVRATGTIGATTYTDDADAQATILDTPLNLTLSKSFDQEELPVPPAGTAQENYPLIDATLVATNTTQQYVGQVTVEDPAPGSTSVYENLNLYRIQSVGTMTGLPAAKTSVQLTWESGYTPADAGPFTIAEAQALPADVLAHVTGVKVVHGEAGDVPTIRPDASSTVVLTYQLREQGRTDTAWRPAETSTPYVNVAEATVDSPGGLAGGGSGTNTRTRTAQDDFVLGEVTYDVALTKEIRTANGSAVVANRYEDETKDYSVRLTARPSGTARTETLTVTDEDPSFWNAFDLTSASALRYTVPATRTPVNAARVSVLVADLGVDGDDALTVSCEGSADVSGCWRTGAWQTATGAAGSTVTLALPAGVAPGDVVGVRVETQSRVDGSPVLWERPTNPVVRLDLLVTRRDQLRVGLGGATDQPVPSTLPTMALAPDESVRGRITDDARADGVARWNATSGAPTPTYAADDQVTTSTLVQHRQNAVKVTKVPGPGSTDDLFLPSETIPYRMVVTNTGDRALRDLVVTDQVDADADGSRLVAPNGDAAFGFALYNAATGGTSQSVAGFAGHLDEATGAVTVTVPAGFTLPKGWRLEITAGLRLRGDLAPDTRVENTVAVRSDRVFDQCRSSHDAYTADADLRSTSGVVECAADTTVRTQLSAEVAIEKRVKGVGAGARGVDADDPNHDDLGVLAYGRADDSACRTPDSDGYYTSPCVPITRPGGTESWKLRLENKGNVAANRVALIDVLPAAGDQGVTLPVARASQFRPVFAGNVQAQGLGADATVTTYYLTSVPSRTCNAADIQHSLGSLASSNACYAQVSGGRGWQELTSSTPGSVLEDVRAIKVVVSYPAGQGLPAGATGSITFDTTTPAASDLAPADMADPIAWNSFASASRSLGAGTQAAATSSVLEPNKVGVAMATGTIDLAKEVVLPTGVDWGPLVPSSFRFALQCTSAGQDVDLVDADGDPLTEVVLPVGGTVHVNDGGSGPYGRVNLPLYADCAIEEVDSAGADVTFAPADATASVMRDYADAANVHHPFQTSPVTPDEVTATNDFAAAGFTLTKRVDDGGAVHEDGDPVAYGPFDFAVSCTWLGSAVPLPDDGRVTLEDGETHAFTDLPAGARCTVEETETDGADSVTATVTGATATGPADEPSFVLAADTAAGPAQTVEFENAYTAAAVEITKQVTGPGAAAWGRDQDFTVRLVCTLPEPSDPTTSRTVHDDTHTLRDGETWRVTGVPTGAACVVSEPSDGGATTTSYEVDGVTLAPGAAFGMGASSREVEVTNRFELGAVSATKALAGEATDATWLGHGVVTAGRYDLTLTCYPLTGSGTWSTTPLTVPGGATRTAVGASTVTWDGLPTGARCGVVESAAHPYTPQVVVVAPTVVVGDDESAPVAVTVTNTYASGDLEVAKVVTGAGAAGAPATFDMTVTCTWGGTTLALPDGGRIQVAGDGTPTTLTRLPQGAECGVVEDDADQTSVTYSATSVTVGGTPVRVTVTNDYLLGGLRVVKRLEGVGASVARGPFTFSVVCELGGRTVLDETVTVAPARGRTELRSDVVDAIPVRSRCTVTETASGDAVRAAAPRTVTITEAAVTAPVEVVQANGFAAGTVAVTKRVTGPFRHHELLRVHPFTVHVVCELDGDRLVDTDVLVLAGRTTVVERRGEPLLLPVGTRCWGRETVDHGATSTTVDHGTRADATMVTSTSTRSLQRSTIRVVNDFQDAPRVKGLSIDVGDEAGTGGRGGDDGDGRDGGDADAAHGGLPDTGSPASPWLLLGGGLAVVLGAGLLVRRRRA
jgi:fimbrial isopeptide formation D2 family protein/LPXTG-motif cell wall-anchored protein